MTQLPLEQAQLRAILYAKLRVNSQPYLTFDYFLLYKYAAFSVSYNLMPCTTRNHKLFFFSDLLVCVFQLDTSMYISLLCRCFLSLEDGSV